MAVNDMAHTKQNCLFWTNVCHVMLGMFKLAEFLVKLEANFR